MILLLCAGLGLGILSTDAVRAGQDGVLGDVPTLKNEPIDTYRTELLELAFDAVSKMPIEPHLKNRSRAQQAVFEACLELGQAELALSYAERIADWRRGLCYVQYACYAAQRGHTEGVDRLLAFAQAAADVAEQDWRRELIFVWIARTQLALGREDHAAAYMAQIKEAPLRGQVETFTASQPSEASFDSLVIRLDELIASNHYDLLRNAAKAYAALYRREYADTSRRIMIEDRIREAYKDMPGTDHIDILLDLTDGALEHSDLSNALRLIEQARRVEGTIRWQQDSEYQYAYLARLAEARYRGGEVEHAIADLDAAMRKYQANRDQIVDIWRADALRPLARAYRTMGHRTRSLEVYEIVVREGMVNPNSRPRAEDFAKTCVSMALQGVEPDATFLARLREIKRQLGPPW